MYNHRKITFKKVVVSPQPKQPLKGLPTCVRNNTSNQDLHICLQKNAFERVANVCEKQCLQVGLICTILDVAFERAADMCKKQSLQVGLICITIEKSPLRGLLTCARNNASRQDLHVQFWMSPLKGLLLYALLHFHHRWWF